MRKLLLAVLLLLASNARAELFEITGKFVCSLPSSDGKIAQQKGTVRDILAESVGGDPAFLKGYGLFYDIGGARIIAARRCDGSYAALFASNDIVDSEIGPTKHEKQSYAITQILTISDWDGAVNHGSITCTLSGLQDPASEIVLSGKGSCIGAFTANLGDDGFCTLVAKIGKLLKPKNDCPT